jgi:DNA-binding LacI/PurR family transcriptional regulator
MATIDDVVRVSGVSRSTVFRFLNGSQVRPAARGAIQGAMRELGYSYDPKRNFGDFLLIVSLKEHYEGVVVHSEMVAGIMAMSSSLGLHMKMHIGPGRILSGEAERLLAERGRVGVIFVGKSDADEEEESAELVAAGVRHVFINRVFEDRSRSFVSIDLRKAAREAVEHLLDLGYDEIGTWGCPGEYLLDKLKFEGYRDAFASRGLAPSKLCFSLGEDGDLEDVARRLLDEGRFPRAWFGLSDTHIMRLGVVLRERGLRVPEDVALVGMDDQETSKFFSPPLTTVRIPFRQAGAAAVEILLGLIENISEESVHMFLKHELVVRESCGAKAVVHG